jgi:uncharacterized membrane protein YkvA (DUF1232 family)
MEHVMPSERSAAWGTSSWNDFADIPDAKSVRDDFWCKARRVAIKLPFARDLLAAYYCAFDHATPPHVRAALIGALVYFVMPIDAVPDVVAVLGYTDDAAVLAGAIRLVAGHIRPEHHAAAQKALDGFAQG